MLPKFIIIGAARCGTSSLFLNLIKHPNVKGPLIGGNKKEVHFFDNHYNRGLGWYKSRFPDAEDTIYIEATPNYLYHPKVPARVKECLPDTKFIILLRNPVDRAWSHYWHWKNKGKWNSGVLKNLSHEILKKGVYIDQLKRWYKLFKGRLLINQSEEYFKDEKAGINRCINWMGLEPMEIEEPEYWDPKRNTRIKTPYPKMPREIKSFLEDFYRPYNQELYEFLDTDFDWDRK